MEWLFYLNETRTYLRNHKDKSLDRLVQDNNSNITRVKEWVENFNFMMSEYNKYLLDIFNQHGDIELYDTYKCKAIWNYP